MRVRVEPNRKCIWIQNFGGPIILKQYVRQKPEMVWIPDGFTNEVFCCGHRWIGMIKVENKEAYYQFSTLNGQFTSQWHDNPSAAFRDVNELCFNKKYRSDINGALLIGVTYPNVQRVIKQHFENINYQGLQVQTSSNFEENVNDQALLMDIEEINDSTEQNSEAHVMSVMDIEAIINSKEDILELLGFGSFD